MNEITVGIIVLIIFIAVFFYGRGRQMTRAESDRAARRSQREAWSEESVVSYGEVQQLREELTGAVEEKLADHPEQVSRLKEIIDEWADLKVKSFEERRSWVRSPKKEE